jgi:multidrug resistance efflux pump
LDNAQTALDDANANLQTVITDLKNSKFLAAEKRLADARAAFLIAETVKKEAENAANRESLLDAANDYHEDAQTELDDAQKDYNDQLTTDEADDVEYARGKLIAAQQRYYAAYARWLSFQTGEESPAVVSALKSLEQAKSAVTQAEANLALLDTQVAKLTIAAPIDGVILARNVEPGEFVQPGAVALTMADLTNLTITVYVQKISTDKLPSDKLPKSAWIPSQTLPSLPPLSILQIKPNSPRAMSKLWKDAALLSMPSS